MTYTVRNAEPPAQAVAGGPQPVDAAGAAARPGAGPRSARASDPGRPGAAHRAAATTASTRGHPHRRSVRAVRGERRRSARAPAVDRLPARSSRCRAGGCRRHSRGLQRDARAHAADHAARHLRPAYVPGDAYNRIHWKSIGAPEELQVKEFDLEQTADLWLFLDLDRPVHAGDGRRVHDRDGRRACCRDRGAGGLLENRAVGIDRGRHAVATLPADRGPRQHQKIMSLAGGRRRRRRRAARWSCSSTAWRGCGGA